MRQFGEVPPWLSSPANAPVVSSTTGLGTGGGAGVFTPIGSGFGRIDVQVGSGSISATPQIVLSFPSANPPTLFFGCPDAMPNQNLTVTGQGTQTMTLSWTGLNLRPNSKHVVTYEWATSN